MDPVSLPNVGDRFLDEWDIDDEVGKGGFSVVYRAIHDDGRVAAVKILTPEGQGKVSSPSYDDEAADRFLREARLLDQLDSAYTINLWDFGESSDGLLYMVFEFIDGRMLFDEIKTNGAMEESRVIHVLRQTLVALECAHDLGIMHRDIKPNNIMLYERDGDPDRVKLVDFGIAKMFDEDKALPGNDLTAAGLLVGTPRYMAPEQLKGQDLTPAADLYSLGLCAIEMLTGKKCIPGKDRIKIVERQLNPIQIKIPESIEVGEPLADIVHHLTQKRLENRYETATEVVRDLEALAGDPGADGDTIYQTVDLSDILPKKDVGVPPPEEEDATIFETINTAELQSIMDRQKAEAESAGASSQSMIDPFAQTMASQELVPAEFLDQFRPPTNDATVDVMPRSLAPGYEGEDHSGFQASFDQMYGAQPAVDASNQSGQQLPQPGLGASHGSGQFQGPPADASYGSGQIPQPDLQQPFGSAPLQQPNAQQPFGSAPLQQPNTQQPFGSGQFQQPPAAQSYGSGQFQQPPAAQSYGSGQFQQPPGQQPYGSGQFPQPGPPQQPYGSGQFQQPPGQQPYGSGQFPPPPGPAGHSGHHPVSPDGHGSGYYTPLPPNAPGYQPPPQMPGHHPPGPYGGGPQYGAAPPLTGDDKLALGASFLVPGVGQIIAGQIAKGVVLMVVLMVSLIFLHAALWVVFALLSLADTFLLVRAQKRRPVGKFETFADWRQAMS